MRIAGPHVIIVVEHDLDAGRHAAHGGAKRDEALEVVQERGLRLQTNDKALDPRAFDAGTSRNLRPAS